MKKIITSLFIFTILIILNACNIKENKDPIIVYTRDTTSGTRGAFFEAIELEELTKSNQNLASGFVEVSSNGDMISSIKNDKNAIGYISLSSIKGSNLKAIKYNQTEASEENVLNGTYHLKRPFMYISKNQNNIKNEIEKQLVLAFLDFINTQEGKEIIVNNDGIVENIEKSPTWESIKNKHEGVLNQGELVEIHFGGSTSVEKIGRALTEVFSTIAPRFKPMHSHTGSGAAYTGTQENGNLHIGFTSRELKEEEKINNNYGLISWDAVVIVANNKNVLTNLNKEEVQAIYKGEIKNWKELEK